VTASAEERAKHDKYVLDEMDINVLIVTIIDSELQRVNGLWSRCHEYHGPSQEYILREVPCQKRKIDQSHRQQ
jgi:hypothetical protein